MGSMASLDSYQIESDRALDARAGRCARRCRGVSRGCRAEWALRTTLRPPSHSTPTTTIPLAPLSRPPPHGLAQHGRKPVDDLQTPGESPACPARHAVVARLADDDRALL